MRPLQPSESVSNTQLPFAQSVKIQCFFMPLTRNGRLCKVEQAACVLVQPLQLDCVSRIRARLTLQ